MHQSEPGREPSGVSERDLLLIAELAAAWLMTAPREELVRLILAMGDSSDDTKAAVFTYILASPAT